MKLAATVLVTFALISPLFSAESSAPAVIKPQARVRLQQTSQGAVAQVEKPAPDPGTVTMDKVVVTDSKLPSTPTRRVEAEPTTFSLTRGGPITTGKIGTLPYEIGLWPWTDVMADDAKFKPARSRIDIEVVRIKF
ncbi:MAG: hypothetical protein Q8N18_10875 [Opitutaceae bacterium]|nr:hypothetical protein [Opitutaceae bacterium]